ncbi:S8 family serine peptidase [Haloarchaeobius sp. DT45]|uniref:S8 family serine peptidase n=1 Tax=Haloarchaeobius sp. DT45 TaxID=3446116 RepID=UPI003F6BE944
MDVNRRELLRSIAAGAVGTQAVGTAGATGKTGELAFGEYIVSFADEAGYSKALALAASVLDEIDFGDRIGGAMLGRFPEQALRALAKHPAVKYVEENGRMEAIGGSMPWGIERVGARTAHALGETGGSVHVAVVDTGIDSDHPDLQANLGSGKSYIRCLPCGVDNACTETWDDDVGHGTHVAGTIAAVANDRGVVGVAPSVTLHAVKVLNCEGWGFYWDIGRGIKYAARQGWDVVNLSIGGADSSFIRDAVEFAASKGVVLVGAAGNDGPCSDCVTYPAAYPEVIGVSATDSEDGLADFSATGSGVDFAAPGVRVHSTVAGGGYGYYNGTSMACPHVTGAMAVLLAAGHSPASAELALQQTAEDVGLDWLEQGFGLVNVDGALGIEGSLGTPPTAATNQPTRITETAARLAATVTDLGSADSVTVSFEWGVAGTELARTTPRVSVSATETVELSITGLVSGETYEYRAVAEGDGERSTGETRSFTTVVVTPEPPAVTTDLPSDVTATSATLHGTLDAVGTDDAVEVFFLYGPNGNLGQSSERQSLDAATAFAIPVTGLLPDTRYDVVAVASWSDGVVYAWDVHSFGTTR